MKKQKEIVHYHMIGEKKVLCGKKLENSVATNYKSNVTCEACKRKMYKMHAKPKYFFPLIGV